MAKFLNTTGVSYHLEELIKSTNDRLILISPYLKFTDRIKEHLQDLNIKKKDIRIVFRDNDLRVEENNWMEQQIGIRTSICPNLHAKCYLNEHEAIVTSMNLYDFSQQNNNEMGIYVTKQDDPQLYQDIFKEVERLLTISTEIKISVKKVEHPKTQEKQEPEVTIVKKDNSLMGFCIRTGKEIPFNIEKPFSLEAYRKWNEYADEFYEEKYCHFSGEKSNGETSMHKPILNKNWKKAKEKFNL